MPSASAQPPLAYSGMSARHGPPHRSTTGTPSDRPSRSHSAMSMPLIADTVSPRRPRIGNARPRDAA